MEESPDHSLSAMVSVLVNEPIAVGVNVTQMVQEEPGARLALRVLVWLNGAAAVTLETKPRLIFARPLRFSCANLT